LTKWTETATKRSAFYLDLEAFVDEGFEDGVHLVGGDFGEVLGGGGAVDGVGHDFAGVEGSDDVEHGSCHLGGGAVEVRAAEEAPLEDEIAVELTEGVDDAGDVVAWGGVVDFCDEVVGWGVDFHDRVVHFAEGVEDLGDVDAGGVGEYGDLSRGGVAVAEGEGVVDDLRELRVEGRFAVAAEGDGVHLDAVGVEVLEFVGEVVAYLFGRGERGVVASVAVPAAFAVDAVEVAEFAFFGEQVDAEGSAEAAAMYRSEDRFFT